jgi:hypothetical protein
VNREGHPAKRIHHRPGWRQKQRIDVIDEHGQKRHELDHIHCCRAGLAGFLQVVKCIGYEQIHAEYSPDDMRSAASPEQNARILCRFAMSP